jgi:dihydrofolate reductase
MRKVKLYIACSLNNKIAQEDGGVEWLEKVPNPEQSDYGYAQFYDSVDTTIMGYATYKQLMEWDIPFPYIGKTNYVLTRRQNPLQSEHVSFINDDPITFIANQKRQAGKDIWLVGGGQVNTLFLNGGLIDEIHVFIMPVILSGGINLFEALPKPAKLKLRSSTTYPGGVVALIYEL